MEAGRGGGVSGGRDFIPVTNLSEKRFIVHEVRVCDLGPSYCDCQKSGKTRKIENLGGVLSLSLRLSCEFRLSTRILYDQTLEDWRNGVDTALFELCSPGFSTPSSVSGGP